MRYFVILIVFVFGCRDTQNAVNSPPIQVALAETRASVYDGAISPATTSADSFEVNNPGEIDTIYVDLAGTRVRLVNSSGGNLIAVNKPLIIVADWNIRAWRESNPLVPVDITSLEYHRSFEYIGIKNAYWRVMLECGGILAKAGQVYSGLPPFTSVPFVATTYGPENLPCHGPLTLTFLNYDVDGEPGGVMKLINNTFSLPETTLFRAPRLWVTYHPVAENTTMIDHEVAWLDAILEDRNGYWPAISRALPVQNHFHRPFYTGEPLVVPPDENKAREGYYHYPSVVLDSLTSRFGAERIDQMGDRINLRVAIISNRLTEKNHENGITMRGGAAIIGRNLSSTTHQPDRGYYTSAVEQNTLIHEIGHCFGLIHTQDNASYPLYPSIGLDQDGYLVQTYDNVRKLNRHEHVDVMASAAGAFNPWVSNYMWTRIVSFLVPSAVRPAVAARAVNTGKRIVTWHEHQHQ